MHPRVVTGCCAFTCSVALTISPVHANTTWDGGYGGLRANVETSSSGDRARVGVSTTSGSVPGVGWDEVVFDEAPVGASDVVETQICRRTNAGEIDPSTSGSYVTVCYTPTDPPPVDASEQTSGDPLIAARYAAAELSVPPPVVGLNPDPGNNQWNAWAIGLPVGVGLDEPAPVSVTTTSQGLRVELTAIRGQIHLDWGDGSTSVCTRWDTRPRTDPRTPPVCGHTYQDPDQYTITATAAWTITWSALDHTGTLPATSTTTHPITIKEFQAVITG